jgi:NAD(P)-dependent dehydrogenase (short-subunit alcohol dehydrogenase family)
MSRFQGKGVLVTGAASGIGKATVERLIGEGATVVGVDLDSDAPAGLGGDRFDYRVLDVLDADAVGSAVAAVVNAVGASTAWCTPQASPGVDRCTCCPTTSGTGSWGST